MSIDEHEAKVLSDFEAYEAEVTALKDRVAELERERDEWKAKAAMNLSAAVDEQHGAERAEADAARLREALRRLLEVADFAPHVDSDAAHQRFEAARAALASAPSAEPTRDMRVAEWRAAWAEENASAAGFLRRAERAEADAARLREALQKYGGHQSPCFSAVGCDCGYSAALASTSAPAETATLALRVAELEALLETFHGCEGGRREPDCSVCAALASAPSAEPTPRDMRVAEAVWEAERLRCLRVGSAFINMMSPREPFGCADMSRFARAERDTPTIDLAAVVAKAVTP